MGRTNLRRKRDESNDQKMKKGLKRKKAEEKKARECDSDDLDELEKDFKILKKGKVSYKFWLQNVRFWPRQFRD